MGGIWWDMLKTHPILKGLEINQECTWRQSILEFQDIGNPNFHDTVRDRFFSL